MKLLGELKRRNVIRMAGLYLVAAWLIVQVADTVLPMFEVPNWVARSVVIVLAIGFVPALIVSWLFELTPDGLRLDDGQQAFASVPGSVRRIDRLIIVALLLLLLALVIDKFLVSPQRAMDAQARQSASLPAATDNTPSLAVLAFDDMSQAGDQAYLSDGIAEEVLNLLAKVPGLRVPSRASSFSFRGKQMAAPEIAERLGVRHLLEGSVRRSGSSIRITAQLIDARTDAHIWSESFDRQADDVLAIQDEIAAMVVQRLKVSLTAPAPTSKPIDPAAYSLYLQARHQGRMGSVESTQQAVALYLRVLELQPDHVESWSNLAGNYLNLAKLGVVGKEKGIELARQAALKAIKIDPGFGSAYDRMAAIEIADNNDLAAAARYWERAMQLDPASTAIVSNAASLMRRLGRAPESIKMLEWYTAREPVIAFGYDSLALSYVQASEWDRALRALQTSLSLSPMRGGVHADIARAWLFKGDLTRALQAVEAESVEYLRRYALSLIHGAAGRVAESDAELAWLAATMPDEEPLFRATNYAMRGEADRAFEWLARCKPGLEFDPALRTLHSDARWHAWLTGNDRSPEQLAAIKFMVKLPP